MNDETRRQLEDYVHKLAHDLQSPVSKIITISEYLTEKAAGLGEEERDFLKRMSEAGWHMKELIEDLSRGELDRIKSLKDLP